MSSPGRVDDPVWRISSRRHVCGVSVCPSLRGRDLAPVPVPQARAAVGYRRTKWPAEGEGAVDRRLVAADRCVGADLKVCPLQLVPDLLVTFLDPVPDALDPGDLGQIRGGRVLAASRSSRRVATHP